jgi:hypothetical protein
VKDKIPKAGVTPNKNDLSRVKLEGKCQLTQKLKSEGQFRSKMVSLPLIHPSLVKFSEEK